MKLFLIAAFLVAAVGGSSTAALARTGHSPAAKSTIHFSHPKGWKTLTQSQAGTLGADLSGSIKDAKLVEIAGVAKINQKSQHGAAAIFAKMVPNKKLAKSLKKHWSVFLKAVMNKFLKNAKKVYAHGSATFAGGKGGYADVTLKSSSTTRGAFYVSQGKGDKSINLGFLVTVPPSQWSKYSKDLHRILNSATIS